MTFPNLFLTPMKVVGENSIGIGCRLTLRTSGSQGNSRVISLVNIRAKKKPRSWRGLNSELVYLVGITSLFMSIQLGVGFSISYINRAVGVNPFTFSTFSL
jgi:hypothetical protein